MEYLHPHLQSLTSRPHKIEASDTNFNMPLTLLCKEIHLETSLRKYFKSFAAGSSKSIFRAHRKKALRAPMAVTPLPEQLLSPARAFLGLQEEAHKMRPKRSTQRNRLETDRNVNRTSQKVEIFSSIYFLIMGWRGGPSRTNSYGHHHGRIPFAVFC